MKNESKDKYNLPRGLWWRETTGRIALCRCPKCGRENYCMNVLSGICTWCGFDANSYYNNDNKSMKLTKNEQWIRVAYGDRKKPRIGYWKCWLYTS